MRLIDADAFHDFISKHCDSSMEELWHELVRRQPTAYDVDKVVERLEKEREKNRKDADVQMHEFGDEEEAYYLDGVQCGIRDAIEIVKSGVIE